MSSSPIKYRSFMKILLCCNIPALSASSLQKKKEEIKLCVKHRTLMKRLWKEEESNCLTLISIETKTIYIVSVFNCMEYIIVDCMLELVIHHFSLQLNTIIQKMNNYLSMLWNLSNPTHQGTREMCRIVQGVGKLRFSF